MEEVSFARKISEEVLCPFCGIPVDRPKEVESGRPREMPVGQCSACGAVYAYDATGHNLGTAFSEALVFACNNDWDLAWNLLPEEDYLQKVVEQYDLETHRIVPGGAHNGRTVRGALYFVRLLEDIQELTLEGVRKRLAQAKPVSAKPSEAEAAGEEAEAIVLTKTDVEALVREYRIEPILRAARGDNKVLRYLQRLLCHSDDLIRLRAADALGRASKVVLLKDPKVVVAVLQGLFKPFSDSSASGWGSIDAIGEIIANAPDLFGGYVSHLIRLLGDQFLQPQVLRALGRIALVRPELVQTRAAGRILPLIHSADPQIRGYAAWLLGSLGVTEARKALADIQDQDEEIGIYEEGWIVKKTLGQLAREALEKLQKKN
ncbi:MAG: DVU0298 family protein [Bacillota bacterium]